MKRTNLIIIYLLIIAITIGIIISRDKWLKAKNSPTPAPAPITSVITPVISPDSSYDNLIKVTEPTPNQVISSPLSISGQARGTWYFEASFPVVLEDANGKVLAQIPAQATGDWMTEDFVPFKTTLTFAKPETTTGKLILKKDNPSGLPENEDQIEIPVSFK